MKTPLVAFVALRRHSQSAQCSLSDARGALNLLCSIQAASPEMLKLKDEGNKLFGRKEYQKALEAYERALKQAGPDAKEEIALLHSNKAACFMMNQK